ncbi:MAG: restriction endonuclease subunit S [Verrucomicrobia bacterium]|nr:restriction endonuclease subunit S [Verrucomicrobiota bacterium]
MKAEGKPALVPKLRFPEFRKAEGWKQVPLDIIADRVTTRNQGGDCTRVLTNSAEHGVVDQRDYFDKDIATAGNLEGYFVVDRGDYVYNPRISNAAPVGPISRNNIGLGVMSPLYTVFRFKNNSTDFYAHYFKTTCWHSYLRQVASMGARHDRMSISVGDFAAMPVPAPSPAEQKKIASCLSSVDELIAAQARKLDALKTHKKGLMQHLFPREGETQPRLRFPEFQNAGEWEVKMLEEIGRVIRGASPRPKGDPRYYGGSVPRLMVQDVTRDGKWVTPQIDSLTKEGAKLSRPCPAGTLTIVCSGVVGVVSFLAVDACIHDGFLALVDINESLASKDFLFHRLSTLREQFERGATHGGVFTNLTTTGVEQLEIAFPSPAEQLRIASCLTAIDDLIATQTQKLEALKTHKKGLMQQLFPSPEENEH